MLEYKRLRGRCEAGRRDLDPGHGRRVKAEGCTKDESDHHDNYGGRRCSWRRGQDMRKQVWLRGEI